MTTTTPKTQGDGAPAPEPEVTFTIDGIEMGVPKGTLVIRAAEELGIVIPRFCDHPLLAPAGACRQCLVEVAMPDREGNLRPMPKPQASCTLEATPGMVVKTQHTSAVADKAQHGQIEFLLINHPLDCPTCDKGGECPLQNQALSNGRGTSRYHDPKRTFPKPLAISTEILLDRDRCILCQRCTRFADQIAGDHFIDLQGRGGGNPGREVHGTHAQQIGGFDVSVLDFTTADGTVIPYEEAPLSGSDGAHGVLSGKHPGPLGAAATDTSGRPFASYFSGNTIQICPVGALTGAAYRFRSRPFDLVSSPSIAEHDASGAAIRVDHRRGVVLRRQAGDDPVVNEEWITDKDRFAYTWQGMPDRLTVPLVRDRADDGTRGELRPASWAEALELAAEGLAAARDAGGVGVLPGGRLPMEDAYAYAKFARVVLGTNDVDHRARPHSVEEEAFLAHRVAGSAMSVTFADLEKAPTTLLVAFEPEDEGGIVFLRLRKGVRARGNRVLSVAPFASRGLERVSGTLITAAPGTEPEVLDAIGTSQDEPYADAAAALSAEGAVILVGERLATVPGGLTAVLSLAERTGARLAWIPRRAGERGGVEVGTLPGLLPGGRQVSDAKARVDVAAVWDVAELPSAAGRSSDKIVAAAADGTLGGLLVGGVDPDDVADPAAMRAALGSVGFVVSLEVRASAVTALADVVLPVAPPVEKAGTFLNWEGRPRRFAKVLTSNAMADHRVLDVLADAMDVELGLHTVEQVRGELDQLAGWDGARARAPKQRAAGPAKPGAGQAVLATWHLLLDAGRCQDGERFLAGTAQRPMARIGQALAESLGVSDGAAITLRTPRGQITLPVLVTPMPDAVVWVPTQSVGSTVRSTLGVDAGAVVDVSAAALEVTETEERPVADDGEAQ